MSKFFILLMFLFLVTKQAFCQDESPKMNNQRSSGILAEYGHPYYYLIDGSRYYITLLGGTFEFPLYKTKNIFNVSVQLFPHIGYVLIFNGKNDFELGLNVRLTLNFSLSPNDVISGKIGSGPHFITIECSRQANSFIFSDYFLGVYKRRIKVSENPFELEFEIGYRHISNAGIKKPNRSIADLIIGIGFYKLF